MTSVAMMKDPTADRPVPAIHVAGAMLLPDRSGAVWWPEESTLLVADLHLEKGSAYAGRGSLVPPYDTAATLARLAAVIAAHSPRRIVSLGDSFHDVGAGDRLPEPYREALSELQRGRDWYWIAGNHDPARPGNVQGDWFEELSVGGIAVRHEPDAAAGAGEIAGHLHPAARVRLRGRGLRRRCFAGDGRRLILPAFGAFTGGLNILDPAYDGLFDRPALAAWMIGGDSVYPIAAAKLLPD